MIAKKDLTPGNPNPTHANGVKKPKIPNPPLLSGPDDFSDLRGLARSHIHHGSRTEQRIFLAVCSGKTNSELGKICGRSASSMAFFLCIRREALIEFAELHDHVVGKPRAFLKRIYGYRPIPDRYAATIPVFTTSDQANKPGKNPHKSNAVKRPPLNHTYQKVESAEPAVVRREPGSMEILVDSNPTKQKPVEKLPEIPTGVDGYRWLRGKINFVQTLLERSDWDSSDAACEAIRERLARRFSDGNPTISEVRTQIKALSTLAAKNDGPYIWTEVSNIAFVQILSAHTDASDSELAQLLNSRVGCYVPYPATADDVKRKREYLEGVVKKRRPKELFVESAIGSNSGCDGMGGSNDREFIMWDELRTFAISLMNQLTSDGISVNPRILLKELSIRYSKIKHVQNLGDLERNSLAWFLSWNASTKPIERKKDAPPRSKPMIKPTGVLNEEIVAEIKRLSEFGSSDAHVLNQLVLKYRGLSGKLTPGDIAKIRSNKQ